jgi:hypothetical protein
MKPKKLFKVNFIINLKKNKLKIMELGIPKKIFFFFQQNYSFLKFKLKF